MPNASCSIASLVKISNKFDDTLVGYVQKTVQKQPKIVPSAVWKHLKFQNYKSDISETWPRYVPAEYL